MRVKKKYINQERDNEEYLHAHALHGYNNSHDEHYYHIGNDVFFRCYGYMTIIDNGEISFCAEYDHSGNTIGLSVELDEDNSSCNLNYWL